MQFFVYFGLIGGAVFFWKAAAAVITGRIDVGWAFESLVARRDEETFMFWYMFAGSVLMGSCGIAMATYAIYRMVYSAG